MTLRVHSNKRVGGTLLALSFVLFAGCKRSPADTREWQVSDHSGERGGGSERSGGTPAEVDDDPRIAVIALYRTQCANCHGVEGRGDGPAGMAIRPADFTSPAFQGARDDDQIRTAIMYGRGAMPSFAATLRPEAIRGLVGLVRSFGGSR